MDPTTVCCPNRVCPAGGHIGQGNIGVHSRKEQRCMCTQCHTTFSATHGTALYRLRTPAKTVTLVLTLLAHGCLLHAIVVEVGFDERTVAAWMSRGGAQSRAVHTHLIAQPRDLGQVQADEIRVKKQGGIVWMALAMMVSTRLWLAGEVSVQRDLPLIRRLLAQVKRCAARGPLLLCTDGLVAYIRAIRETFREPMHTGQRGRPRLRPWRYVCSAQVVKRYERRRVVAIERRVIAGTPARVETLRRQSQGGGVINTASSERLHATFRERLAALTRRGRALARHLGTLEQGLYLIGTVYNFCTPHMRLGRDGAATPAMAAQRTDHCWTVQELLAFHVSLLVGHHPSGVGALHERCNAW